MAVRDDFIAGEVLAAADLNDTFAAKAPVASPTFTGTVTLPDSVVGSQSPNRNLLYNGAMQVAQRGTSTTGITTTGYYTADRWNTVLATMGTWTQTSENDAPTGSGFTKSLKLLCTTADASPAAGDFLQIRQGLEGQDLQRIAKGTASAQQLTLSFWVKSNVTGTYIVNMQDLDNTRAVSASYTVSASATWERKTITFPADTTGVFDNDNAQSLVLDFYLGAGSDSTSGTLATAWESTSAANIAPGQTNLAAATNNYWQVTGVQLEVGPVATPFEFKSYGQELRECQRYFVRRNLGTSGGNVWEGPAISAIAISSTDVRMFLALPQVIRSQPAVSTSGTIRFGIVASQVILSSPLVAGFTENQGVIQWTATGAPVGAGMVNAGTAAPATATIDISAEL